MALFSELRTQQHAGNKFVLNSYFLTHCLDYMANKVLVSTIDGETKHTTQNNRCCRIQILPIDGADQTVASDLLAARVEVLKGSAANRTTKRLFLISEYVFSRADCSLFPRARQDIVAFGRRVGVLWSSWLLADLEPDIAEVYSNCRK